jgi:hypothetical protein
MAGKHRETRIVETLRAFDVPPAGPKVHPGERVWAWPGKEGWNVVFNGLDVPVANGVVGDLDSPEVKQAAEARKAQMEAVDSSTPAPATAPPLSSPPVPEAIPEPLPAFPEEDDAAEEFGEPEIIEDDEEPPV